VNTLFVKHLLVRTPFEKPAQRLRHLAGYFHRRMHPELHDLYLESERIELVMARLIDDYSNCIDIGCHIGSSLSAMVRYAPRGKHVAFEPVPEKVEWLKRKFPEVDVKAVALGESRGKVKFYNNLLRSGFSGFGNDSVGGDETAEIVVDCERLDDLVCDDRRYSYIKIDVEGAELIVLKGGRETIMRDRPVILFESSHDGAAKIGLSRDDLFCFFVDELRYNVFMIQDYLESRSELNLLGFQKAAEYPFLAFNFLAAPR